MSSPDNDQRYQLILSTALLAGAIYVVATWWSPFWFLMLGQAPVIAYEEYQANALGYLKYYIIILIPPLVMVLCLLFTAEVRDAFKERWKIIILSSLIFLIWHVGVIVLFVYSNESYLDRSYKDEPFKMALLLKTHQYLAMVVQGVELSIIKPLIEEVVFRFGLMRWVYWKCRSKSAAVVISSAAFSLGHINTISGDPVEIVHFIYITLLGVVFGILTIWRDWKISVAFAIHCIVNAIGYIILILMAVYRLNLLGK